MDDFTLAVETVRIYTEAFQAFLDDMNRAQFDMRVLSKTTVSKMRAAGEKRKELSRRIEIARAEMEEDEGGRH